MSYHNLARLTYLIPLPSGKLAVRFLCPNCRSVHIALSKSWPRLCWGCGMALRRYGGVLHVCSVSAERERVAESLGRKPPAPGGQPS